MKLKIEEMEQWLDNPVTQMFLEGIDMRMKILEDAYSNGATYMIGNPFLTSEHNAAHFARVDELANIVEQPLAYLDREEQDERDWDTTGGTPPISKA